MATNLSRELLAQLYGQHSDDPFLTLVTLSHSNFSTIRLVANTEDVISRGETFLAFPFRITLPTDDGETAKTVQLEIDNTSLELIDEIRGSTTPIDVKVEMILSSLPNIVQYDLPQMRVNTVTYTKQSIIAVLALDGFLQTSLDAERYTPINYPGLF